MSDLISRKKLKEIIEPMVGKFDDDGEFWWTRESVLRAINSELVEVEAEAPKFIIKKINKDDIEQYVKSLGTTQQMIVYDVPATIEPIQKVGKWEECRVTPIEDTTITEIQSAFCPICRKYHTTPYMYYFDYFNYCPNCGAKMKGVNDD